LDTALADAELLILAANQSLSHTGEIAALKGIQGLNGMTNIRQKKTGVLISDSRVAGRFPQD
jgi:hypothetical protein